MNILSDLSAKFWSPSVWLPPNTTWADIAPGTRNGITYPDSRHLLWYPIPFAIVILILRHFIEK